MMLKGVSMFFLERKFEHKSCLAWQGQPRSSTHCQGSGGEPGADKYLTRIYMSKSMVIGITTIGRLHPDYCIGKEKLNQHVSTLVLVMIK
jgi:hypothetical protein